MSSHYQHLQAAVAHFSAAIGHLPDNNAAAFDRAVRCILNIKGHLIICGMGKSGLIGQKISASLSSTGTPSFFMHPGEALHGDLGMVTTDDALLLISNSGETFEISTLLPVLKTMSNPLIGMVGNQQSLLARESDICLQLNYEHELCPNNLAPTTSTLLSLAMGDALTVALMQARKFDPDDFARFHPGGELGRKLLTRVKDSMSGQPLPLVSRETLLHDALLVMSEGRMGLCLVFDGSRMRGIVTDGDVRRALVSDRHALQKPVGCFMSSDPVTIDENCLLTEAESLMRKHKIKSVIVTSEKGVTGILEFFN